MNPWYQIPTPRGHSKPEAASALQKAIRRSDDDQALYWAIELDRAGHGQYVWKRLLIICSEDIGLADPQLPASIRALYDNWKEMVEWRNGHGPERLMMVHAVLLLARAPKSRMVDHALHYHYTEDKQLYDVPSYALDLHTARGRQMGNGDDHWYEEASVLVGKADLGDKWEELSKQAQYAGKQDQTRQRTAKGNPEDPQQSLEV